MAMMGNSTFDSCRADAIDHSSYGLKPVIPIRSIPHRQYSLHRFKVSKIALTQRIERVYIPKNRHALKGLARQFCAISPRL